MKNTTKKALKAMLILTMLVTLCVALAACAQTTETGATDPIVLELVNVGLDILAKAAIAAIGLAGAWATAKIGQNNKLANIKAAIGQVTQAAQTTVGELQQTTVEAMKAAAADGKLTEDQIRTLKADLLRMTREKLAEPTVQLLEAAKLDINAMIQGAAEDLINRMHTTQQLIAGELIVEQGDKKGDRKTRPPFAFYAGCYAGVIFDTERARFASERAPLQKKSLLYLDDQ